MESGQLEMPEGVEKLLVLLDGVWSAVGCGRGGDESGGMLGWSALWRPRPAPASAEQ